MHSGQAEKLPDFANANNYLTIGLEYEVADPMDEWQQASGRVSRILAKGTCSTNRTLRAVPVQAASELTEEQDEYDRGLY